MNRKRKKGFIEEFIEDGKELIISPRIHKFLLGCCRCGLIHQMTIKRKKDIIILKLKRVN